MDNKLTQEMAEWLRLEHPTAEQVERGALLLLKLNRNRILYQNILRRPGKYEAKLRYELRKFLRIRQDGLTMDGVRRMQREVTAPVEERMKQEEKEPSIGKRQDHELLPERVRALWDRNAERWKRIKELYNQVLELREPCDRYEHLVAMKDAWYKYKADMAAYDAYDGEEERKDTDSGKSPTDIAKAVISARSYISKTLPKIKAMRQDEVNENYAPALAKLTQRVEFLLLHGQEIGQELRVELAGVGVDIAACEKLAEEHGQGDAGQ